MAIAAAKKRTGNRVIEPFTESLFRLDRARSSANKASEGDANLLYDGVADTLVSLLSRNASTCT
jgi:hypothetical protein